MTHLVSLQYQTLRRLVTHQVLSLLAQWAQTNPTNQVSLFGMINLRAPLFPFAMLLLDLVQAGPGAVLVGATGIVAAHAYFFAKIVSDDVFIHYLSYSLC